MMRIRGLVKYIIFVKILRGFYGIPYIGERVYFPRNAEIVKRACSEGVFERVNVQLLSNLARKDSVFFDVGANIGLISIAILKNRQDLNVVSFEPSPNSLPYLQKTQNKSSFGPRWIIVEKAVGAARGEASYYVARSELGIYDGLANTMRAEMVSTINVLQTTIDDEWTLLGRPDVSIIKIDVEGGEIDVLLGSRLCIEACRPFIVLEWNASNFSAYTQDVTALLHVSRSLGYKVSTTSSLTHVQDLADLRVSMALTESFLLLPQ